MGFVKKYRNPQSITKSNFSIFKDKGSFLIEAENFKTNNKCFVFLCSGKIGGEGLNLTEANHAIFFNAWWNPSNNNQARDRIIRIGQKKEAYIHYIYSQDTIETRVIKILNTKNFYIFKIFT